MRPHAARKTSRREEQEHVTRAFESLCSAFAPTSYTDIAFIHTNMIILADAIARAASYTDTTIFHFAYAASPIAIVDPRDDELEEGFGAEVRGFWPSFYAAI